MECGFGQADVTPGQIAAFYDKAYFAGETAVFGQTENSPLPPSHRFWIEQQLAPLKVRGPLKVLEIGPGLGGPLAGFFERERPDISYAAIEFSEYAAEKLCTRGLHVYAGRVVDEAILSKCRGTYDLVFGTEVIEHDLEPSAFILACYAMLKPGGRVAFTTGNLDGLVARSKKADWYYLDPPAHVSYYTPAAARHALLSAGFTDISVTRFGFRHIDMALRTKIPGLLWLTDKLNLSTGMTISGQRP